MERNVDDAPHLSVPAPQKHRRTRFFLFAAIAVFAAAIIGFGKTFFAPLAAGTFNPPGVVFVHAGFFFAWVCLFLSQAALIRSDQRTLHMAMGPLAVGVAIGLVLSCIAVGVTVLHREVAAGRENATVGFVYIFTGMAIFLSLFGSALIFRRRPDVHKRLMLLATLSILWPALFRFRHYFPSVPYPELVFAVGLANLPIVLGILHDKFTVGRVHPVYSWVGGAVICEQLLETYLFESGNSYWRMFGAWLASPFLKSAAGAP